MAIKTARGIFTPKNPQKYIGPNISNIQYRSGWELQFMVEVLDKNPNIIGWSSESISIPYVNPLTGQTRSYVPDFFIVYCDKTGAKKAEIIEIKPLKESPLFEGRVSRETKLVQAINAAKWAAAAMYCKKRGIGFRVATERDLFGSPKGRR